VSQRRPAATKSSVSAIASARALCELSDARASTGEAELGGSHGRYAVAEAGHGVVAHDEHLRRHDELTRAADTIRREVSVHICE
jgi:hypothetical protein